MNRLNLKSLSTLLLSASCALTFAACGDDGAQSTNNGTIKNGPGGKGDTAGGTSTSTGSSMDTSTTGGSNMGTSTSMGSNTGKEVHPAVAALPEDPGCSGKVKRFDGRTLTDEEIKSLDDPFGRWVLRAGDKCPSGFDEVMEKLAEFDNGGCDSAGEGNRSMVVSESAQILDMPTNYRVVTSRRCNTAGSRDSHGLLFSLFGVGAVDDVENPGQLPQTVEVMGFDEEKGIFNFYEVGGGKVEFFGNSVDILKKENLGDNDAMGRCATCHTGGGAVMKELDTPWVHWEGHTDTPGAADLVKAHKTTLGSKASGSTMEGITKRANSLWNGTRLETLQEIGTAQDVLRPLFCSVEVNLDNGTDFTSDTKVDFGADFFLDPAFGAFGSVSIDVSEYEKVMEKVNQRLSARGSDVMKEGDIVRDTIFLFTFIERSHIDNNYVELLEDVVGEDFLLDVLNVDMTRPVLSEERCDLLKHVPAKPLTKESFEAVSKELVENLEGLGSPNEFEAALLENLTNDKKDAAAHKKAAKDFLAACKSREPLELLDDIMKVASWARDAVRDRNNPIHNVFEFPLTMPIDDLNTPDSTRLDPETCTIK